MKWCPVFVATFADGETIRMTTHCKKELDWGRGRSLAKHAWQTRDRQRRIKKSPAKTEDREPPAIASYHFEVDGQVIEAPQKKE